MSPLPKMKPYQISSKKRVFITEAPKRRGSSQEAIGPESSTSRGRGSFEKVRDDRNQKPRLKSSLQNTHKVLGVKREVFKTQFGRKKVAAVPAPVTRIPTSKLLTGAKNNEKIIIASRTYRLNLSPTRVLRPLIVKLGNNETVEAKRSLINAESM